MAEAKTCQNPVNAEAVLSIGERSDTVDEPLVRALNALSLAMQSRGAGTASAAEASAADAYEPSGVVALPAGDVPDMYDQLQSVEPLTFPLDPVDDQCAVAQSFDPVDVQYAVAQALYASQEQLMDWQMEGSSVQGTRPQGKCCNCLCE